MKPRGLLIAVGVSCFLVFVLVSLPARVITALLPGEIVEVTGISGTLWNGQARLVQAGDVQLTATNWSLSPAQLLLGRLALSIETHSMGSAVSGDVTLSITGTIAFRNVDALGPFAPVAARMNLPPSGGDVSLRIEELAITNEWPSTAVGNIRIADLPLNIIGVAAGPVGTYEVAFTSDAVAEDGRIVGALQDLDGPLEIAGEILFDPPRNYALNARVKAGAGAPSDLVRGLALLGPADAGGFHEFVMSGSL